MAFATSSTGKPLLFLHVGTAKTGTSAVQAFFALNRDAFRGLTGIQYAPSESDERAMKGKPTAGNAAQIARHLRARRPEHFEKALRMLRRRLDGEHGAYLLSSEALWQVSAERFAALRDALAGEVEVRVVCYIRAQVKHVESAYLQVLGNRGYDGDIAQFFETQSDKYFAGARLRTLQALFGAENVVARKYDRRSLVGGDVVDDMLSVFGVGWDERFTRPEGVNSSLDAEHYLYARAVSAASQGAAVGKQAMRELRGTALFSSLYDDAPAIRDLPIMDAETARRITALYVEDNQLLDTLVPGYAFGFNEDNRRAAEEIEARAERRPVGFTRLELMLLNRLAQLEARLDRLSPEEGASEEDEG